MGRMGYISHDKKIEAVEKYLRGEGSHESIAREYGVTQASFQQWPAHYEVMGPAGLATKQTNNRYSIELKNAAVEAYLRGEGSQVEICKRFVIRSKTQIQKWIKVYLDIRLSR